MVRGLIAVLCVLAFGASASTAGAATFSVTGFDDPAGATCGATTCPSLRAAVTAANADIGDTISLGAGTYTLTGPALTLTRDMTITGAGKSATTIQQTAAGNGVIVISNATATVAISDLTVTGGDAVGTSQPFAASGNGLTGGSAVGGILDQGALTLTRVAVTGNRAVGGAGGSAFSGFPGAGGPAVGAIEAAGALTLDHSAVTANVAAGGSGGASELTDALGGGAAVAGVQVDVGAGAVTISGSDISGNTATGGQGGRSDGSPSDFDGAGGPASGALLALSAAPVSISATTINDNIATGGTGGGNTGPTPTPAIAGDGGAVTGGGIDATGGPVTVTDSTMDGNTLTGGAGGVGLHQSGDGATATGGAIAIRSPATLILRRATVGVDTASGGPGGSAGIGIMAIAGAGAFAQGGGVYVAGTASLVDVTIAKNSAISSYSGLGGLGGGIFVQAVNPPAVPSPGGSLVLASATVSANAAEGPGVGTSAGANVDAGLAPVQVSDTIFNAPIGPNCSIVGSGWTDFGHNLESTTPSQCQLTTADDDVIGADPQFGPLADHGGPGPTLAPGPASPARGAGGACSDPSLIGNPLLTVDERGTARHSQCDIGSYETQPAVAMGAVLLTGPAVVGQALTCPTTAFAGDAPLSFSFAWSRGGSTSSSYTPVAGDAGQPVSCTVTASNAYGSASATSNTLTISSGPAVTGNPPSPRTQKFTGATLRSAKLVTDRKGHVAMTLGCPKATPGGRCAISVSLYSRTGSLHVSLASRPKPVKKAVRLAKGAATIAAGKTKKLKLKLNRAGRRAANHLPLSVRVVLIAQDPAKTKVTQTIRATVRAAKVTKHHRGTK